jgi:uncharacterized protein (TIGR00369 family)
MKKVVESLQQILGVELPFDELLNRVPDLKNQVVLERVYSMLKHVYETQMPFNVLLGVKVDSLTAEMVTVSIDMKPDLIGNYQQKIIHGGVISALLDLAGGIAVQTAGVSLLDGSTVLQMIQRFSLTSTIDMRVDYLRPGAGSRFIVEAKPVRVGRKVGVCRMDMKNENSLLIAQGTAAYMVG